MSTAEPGILEGQVMVRPWKVGLLIDTNSRSEVEETMRTLSQIWGGYYFPILDRNAKHSTIDRMCAIYEVDSLYTDETEGPIADLARRPGYKWPGRGRWGPFKTDGAYFRRGLLRTATLLRHQSAEQFILPKWESDSPENILHLANWGDSGDLAKISDSFASRLIDAHALPIEFDKNHRIGAVQSSRFRIQSNIRNNNPDMDGLFVVDHTKPAQVIDFWNQRATGAEVFAISAESSEHLWNFMLGNLGKFAMEPRRRQESSDLRRLSVFSHTKLKEEIRPRLQDWANNNQCEILLEQPVEHSLLTHVCETKTNYKSSFRSEFRPGTLGVHLRVPDLPWRDADIQEYFPGTVAAVVSVTKEIGQDPRLTANVPAFRRHSDLLMASIRQSEVDEARVCGDGLAFLVQANTTDLQYPFVYNMDVVQRLFDDPSISVSQSDNGKFQSRTAEKLGGQFSTFLQQPAVREILYQAVRRPAGLTLKQIRGTMLAKRGEWPDQLFSPNADVKAFANKQTNTLLATGLLVALLDVHCSFCRVVSQVHPKDLDSVVQCEFCGERTLLALSIGLTSPLWRFKLAGHLATAKVEAMLPVLAALSVLAQLEHSTNTNLCHVLGAELSTPDRKVEMDIVTIIRDHSPIVVLGEVKNSNRISAEDVSNIEYLQSMLRSKRVVGMPIFVTLKDKFSEQEISTLRNHCSSVGIIENFGQAVPIFPLLFTGPDLSHPWGHEDHPWKWSEDDPRLGLYGVAIESCRRNLGLVSFKIQNSSNSQDRSVVTNWE